MLEQYTCTRCHTHPFKEKEIFFGCAICGNKLFKLEDSLEKKLEQTRNFDRPDHTFDGISSIEVSGAGMYHVNIDNLLKTTSKTKKGPLLVSEEEGVYHIKL